MANSFFVPFNHQPDSVSINTAPVTLGADEYARLIVLHPNELDDNAAGGSQGITIDGTLVVPQTQITSADIDTTTDDITIECSGTLYYYTQSGVNLQCRINGTNLVNFSLTIGFTSGYNSITVMAGDLLDVGGSNSNFKGFIEPFEPVPKELWLPPSTVISSGDGALVRPYMLEIYKPYS